MRVSEVGGRNPGYALAEDGVSSHARAEAEVGDDGELRPGVVAFHVRLGLGLGVAALLSFAENVGEWCAGLLNLGEDEVAGAVEDAVDGFETIRRDALAQRVQDGDAATSAGFQM